MGRGGAVGGGAVGAGAAAAAGRTRSRVVVSTGSGSDGCVAGEVGDAAEACGSRVGASCAGTAGAVRSGAGVGAPNAGAAGAWSAGAVPWRAGAAGCGGWAGGGGAAPVVRPGFPWASGGAAGRGGAVGRGGTGARSASVLIRPLVHVPYRSLITFTGKPVGHRVPLLYGLRRARRESGVAPLGDLPRSSPYPVVKVSGKLRP